MNTRSTQPRRARIGLMGLTVAALSFVAWPGSLDAASYPPGGGGEQLPPPAQVPPEQLPPAGGVLAGGATVTSADALPATGGSDPSQILWIASSALLAGVVISGVSLRRRNLEHAAS